MSNKLNIQLDTQIGDTYGLTNSRSVTLKQLELLLRAVGDGSIFKTGSAPFQLNESMAYATGSFLCSQATGSLVMVVNGVPISGTAANPINDVTSAATLVAAGNASQSPLVSGSVVFSQLSSSILMTAAYPGPLAHAVSYTATGTGLSPIGTAASISGSYKRLDGGSSGSQYAFTF